jgi:hypothetical protein
MQLFVKRFSPWSDGYPLGRHSGAPHSGEPGIQSLACLHRASSFRDAPKAQARNPFDHLRRGEMDFWVRAEPVIRRVRAIRWRAPE